MPHPILPLRPLHDRVLIARPKKATEVTASGLYIPESATVRANEGIVAAIGAGRVLRDGSRATPEVKAGDHVLWAKYAEQVLPEGIEAGEFAMMRESDILAVLTN